MPRMGERSLNAAKPPANLHSSAPSFSDHSCSNILVMLLCRLVGTQSAAAPIHLAGPEPSLGVIHRSGHPKTQFSQL